MNNSGEALNKAAEEMLTAAAHMYNEKYGNDIELPTEEVEFSERSMKKMQKLFKMQRRKEAFAKFSKYGARAACILLACGVVAAAANVDAWRRLWMNFTFEPDAINTDFTFIDEDTTKFVNDDISLNYIPHGFSLDKDDSINSRVKLIFKNDNENYFEVQFYWLDDHVNIDTEKGTVENVIINDCEGIFTESKLTNSLIWHDEEYGYIILGSIPRKEIMQIAQNMQVN